MAILNDPAPGLRPSMTKESINNFKAAEWGVGKMGRGLVGVVNIRSGIITIAVGWTASLPQLADLTKNTWGKNHVATLLPPGSKVTEKTDHMLPPLPRGPLGPKKNYPPPQMAAAKSSVAGKPHLPIVHAKYGTQDDRFGHVPATSHYQVLRLLETSDATVSGGRDPYGAVPAVQNLRQKWAQLRNDPYSQEAVNAIVEAERLISTHALQAAEKKQEEMLAEDYLGFGIWKQKTPARKSGASDSSIESTTFHDVVIRFRSGTLNKDKQQSGKDTLENEGWKLFIATGLIGSLNSRKLGNLDGLDRVLLDVPNPEKPVLASYIPKEKSALGDKDSLHLKEAYTVVAARKV